MQLITLFAGAAALAGLASAVPVVAINAGPNDGFPNPNAQQLAAIQTAAGGTLSNAPPPPKIANSSLTAFQLIAFNENFEVAFFSSLLNNITSNVAGYELPTPAKKDELVAIIKSVLAVRSLLPLLPPPHPVQVC